MKITLFGTCRLNKIENHNNLNNLINYTHSTKEVIQMIKFLKGELLIPQPYNLLCFRTGIVDRKYINYDKMYTNIFIDTSIFVIEICSNKVYCHNGYYLHHLSVDKRYNYYQICPLEILNNHSVTKQSNEEIENDILEIRKLLYPKQIIIVSHYNSKINGEFFNSRNNLINLLNNVCKKNNIYFINPTNVLSNFSQEEICEKDLGHYNDLGLCEFSNYVNNYIKQLINYNIKQNLIYNIITHYKAIILVLASNESPITKNSRRIWKKYMNMEPTFKVFFVYGKLFEPLEEQDENDLIYNDIKESYPVTFHKTFEAMKFIESNFSYEYFIRTNISTFWDFEKLKTHLDTLPRTNCYSGDGPFPIREFNYSCLYVSGTDTIVTREMIKSMVSNKDKINFGLIEDAAMGHYFNGILKVPILPNRICFFEDIRDTSEITKAKIEERIKNAIKENKDHYRVKTLVGNRYEIDNFIYKILLKYIYDIAI